MVNLIVRFANVGSLSSHIAMSDVNNIMPFQKLRNFIPLLAILILAIFLRLWQIDSVPPGLYPDIAINGHDALDTLATGQFKVFYPENNGREGLFIWLIALSFKIFGPAVWSLRLVSAVFGLFPVWGLYLLTRRVFNKKIARRSSFFLAVSFWHINFSRLGFRAILVPFFLVWSFYFLFRGIAEIRTCAKLCVPHLNVGHRVSHMSHIIPFILAGLFFGLGFYTYIAFRAAVLILGAVFLLEVLTYWRKNKPFSWRLSNLWQKVYLKDGWWKWDIMFLTIVLVILPLAGYFYQHPQDFIGRSAGVSVFNAPRPWLELGKSVLLTLGMFNFKGDLNWRHNFSGSPMLVWPVGLFFVLGFVLTIKNIFLKNGVKIGGGPPSKGGAAPNFENGANSIFLLTWFLSMLSPALLTNEGLPHALRAIGVIPVVYIFAALGLFWLANRVKKLKPKKPAAFLGTVLLIFILMAVAFSDFNQYFFKWAKNPEVAGAMRLDLVDLSQYLNNLPASVKKYVIVNEPGVAVPYPHGLPMPAQTIIFIQRTANSEQRTVYLTPSDINQIKIVNHQPAVIIPTQPDQNIFNQLSQKWPQGKIEKINYFYEYKINQ